MKTSLKIKKYFLRIAFSLAFWAAILPVFGQPNLPKQTSPPRMVHDLAQIMSASERGVLEGRLQAYDDSTSSEVAILTVPTLDGYPLDDYALEVFNSWKIGDSRKNNGALILVAIKERKIKIQVGAGLGQTLTATQCAKIIDNYLKPAFRQGKYFDGFSQSVSVIQQTASGEFRSDGSGGDMSDGMVLFIVLFGILFFAFIFYMSHRARQNQSASYGTRQRKYRKYDDDDGWRSGGGTYWGGGWSSGGGSSWGDGGGSDWGGFGGGESDGGGASGDW